MKKDLVDRYRNVVLPEVKEKAPNAWDSVVALVKRVPKTIDIKAFWKFGKDKPCWSNIRVHIGDRIVSDLSLSKDFDSFELIASDEWKIVMRNKGSRWKSNKNFDVTGESAKKYISSLLPGGIASYRWRLYAIRQYALSLCKEDGTLPMVRSVIDAPHCLTSKNIYSWSKQFAIKAGMGWGIATVNHLLTDLGLSVKPDLHLRRSAVRIGLLNQIPSDLPVEEIDRNAAKLDPKIVQATIDLAAKVKPTADPTALSATREVDKVLMEWSRKGFLRPL